MEIPEGDIYSANKRLGKLVHDKKGKYVLMINNAKKLEDCLKEKSEFQIGNQEITYTKFIKIYNIAFQIFEKNQEVRKKDFLHLL